MQVSTLQDAAANTAIEVIPHAQFEAASLVGFDLLFIECRVAEAYEDLARIRAATDAGNRNQRQL